MCTNSTKASVSFIMAMQWDYVSKRNFKSYCKDPFSISMEDRLNMKKALNLLFDDKENWKPYPAVNSSTPELQNPWSISSDDKAPLYKEYLYYNHNTRQIIYNQDEVPKESESTSPLKDYAALVYKNQRNVVVLERKLQSGNSYYYLVRKAPQNNSCPYVIYRLPISSIELRVYDVGIFLLSIRCNHETSASQICYEKLEKNYLKQYFAADKSKNITNNILDGFFKTACADSIKSTATESDLAWILDCGRRLFCPRNLQKDDYPCELPLYSCLSLNSNETEPIVLCDYTSLGKAKVTHAEEFPWLSKLISEACISARSAQREGSWAKGDYLILDSFNDDRMYLHGNVVSDLLSRSICSAYVHRANPCDEQKAYLMKWHAIAFADNNWDECTCPDFEMVRKLAEGYTYPRWTGYKTLYALNYHNMIQLMGSKAPDYLTTNMDWIYYQLFLVGILQRCCLQRFYREASGIPLTRKINKAALRTALKDKYIIFLNRIWGNEVTEQEQGKEMFDILQKNMMLEKDVSFLDQALEELSEQERKSLDTSINKILIPFSIISGISTISDLMLSHKSTIIKSLQHVTRTLGKWGFLAHWVCYGLCTLSTLLIIWYTGNVLIELLKRPLAWFKSKLS